MSQFISFKELKARGIPYSETHLYRMMKAGQFPKCVKLGEQVNSRRSWIASEVDQWIAARIDRRDREPSVALPVHDAMLAELRQCAVELEEAANVLRPTMPSLSSIYVAAAKRTAALIAKVENQ